MNWMIIVWVLLAYAGIESILIVWPKRLNPISKWFRRLIMFHAFALRNPLMLGVVAVTAPLWVPDFLFHPRWYQSGVTDEMFSMMSGMVEDIWRFGRDDTTNKRKEDDSYDTDKTKD